MQTTRFAMVIGGALLVTASAAGAQGRNDVPPGQMPSPGMCRIWINGVPPGRQPAQTDCDTARRTVPPNGRIIYGSQVSTNTPADPRHGTGTGQPTGDPRRGGWGGLPQSGQSGSNDPRRTADGRYDGRDRGRADDRDDDDRDEHHDKDRYDGHGKGHKNREEARFERERRERERVERARDERERRLARERERRDERERERLAREWKHDDWRRDHQGQQGQQQTQSGTRVYPGGQQTTGRAVTTVFGTVRPATPGGCVDANRDGVCDVTSVDPRKTRP